MFIVNLFRALRDQMPLGRAYHNFFVTRNAWGMFHKNSHISQRSGKPKIAYGHRSTAERAAKQMNRKYGNHYSVYKCVWCDGYHIGRNRQNK